MRFLWLTRPLVHIRHMRFTKRQFWLILVILGLILPVAYYLAKNRQDSPGTYADNLSGLIESLEDLDSKLYVPEMNQIEADLDAYRGKIDELTQYCRRLINQKQPNNTNEGKNIGERAKGICDDLLPVMFYTDDLHKKLREYLLIQDTVWPNANTQEFKKRLEFTLKVIEDTKNRLELLDNRKIQDPALEELIFQVKSAQEIALKIKNESKDNKDVQKRAEELRRQLSRDRSDFLAARTYFWKNTIGIAQLHKALSDVEEALGQSDSKRTWMNNN
jgi:hypothetical protein